MKSTVIYGPPGCGKSTEIMRRYRAAIDSGLHPDRIGLISFTRAAAQELARRAGVEPGKNAATLHSFCFRICGMSRTQVVDRDKLREFSKISKVQTTGAGPYEQEKLDRGDFYLAAWNLARATMNPDLAAVFKQVSMDNGSLAEFEYFTKVYTDYKQKYGYVDFTDMLERARTLPPPGFDMAFLDEAQDFSPLQWAVIEHWLPNMREVVLALDDDQAIHVFNGADPRGGPEFERRHGSERVVLRQSYRLHRNIFDMANRLIGRIQDRVPKEFEPVEGGGAIKFYGDVFRVPVPKAGEDTLVLFRNHSQRKILEDWLMTGKVPFLTRTGYPGPMQGRWARAITIWKDLQQNVERCGQLLLEDSRLSLLVSCLTNPTVLSEERIAVSATRDWWQVMNPPPVLTRYLRGLEQKYGTHIPPTRVLMSTIHGAKGWEADRVILLNAMGGRTDENFTKNPDAEIRVFYVGVTRAKLQLDVINGENPLPRLK